MAAPVVLTPEAAMSLTNDLAAADPKHDFEHDRGTPSMQARLKATVKKILGGGREEIQFSQLYDRHRDIGTVGKPRFEKARNIWNEWKTFEMVTGMKREDFFNAEGDRVGEFKTSTEQTYKFRSLRVKTGGAFEPGLTAESLFTKLTEQVPDKSDIYFTIDAVNCSFYELLTEASNKGAPEIPIKTFHYCMFREGENDSAGKVCLDPYEKATADGHKVKLKVHRDTGGGLVTYPFYDGDLKDPSTQFNSIYTVEVKGAGSGIGSTVTTFKNKGFNKTVEIVKGKKEDHPNAVNSLVPVLAQVLRLFEKEAKVTPATKHLYATALQQKRSGDWLPVLATLQPGRIPTVPAFARIATGTEDILCGAFGLNRGGDVLLTLRNIAAGGVIEQWLVYCTLQTGAETNEAFQALKAQQLVTEIQRAKVTNVEWTPAGGGAVQTKDLAELVASYQARFEERVTSLWGELDSKLGELSELIDSYVANEALRPDRIKSSADLLAKTRAVLRAMYKTARFYCQAPKIPSRIQGGEIEGEITRVKAIEDGGAGAEIAVGDYEEMASLFQELTTIKNTIQTVLKGGTKSGSVLTPEQALQRGINSIAEGATGSLASAQRREQQKYIDKFLLFSNSIFIRGNPQTNAIGLFELFTKIPEDARKAGVKTVLKTKFEALRDRLIVADDKKAITLFLKTFEVITYAEPAAGAALAADEVSEADVIACIHENDNGAYIEVEGAEAAEGAAGLAAVAEADLKEIAEEAEVEIPEPAEAAPAPILELPGRHLIQSSLFTPALRVLKSLGSAGQTLANLMSTDRFLQAQLPQAGPGAGEGGGTGRKGTGRSSLRLPSSLDLHPFTYLFFYLREIKFQLEAGNRDPNLLRLGQLLVVWFSNADSIYKTFKFRRSPFTVRYLYGLLQAILLGWAPELTGKTPPVLKEFYVSIGIDRGWLATFTATTNDGYFGSLSIPAYRKITIETMYKKAILFFYSQRMKSIAMPNEKVVGTLTHSLELLQTRVLSLLPELLDAERAFQAEPARKRGVTRRKGSAKKSLRKTLRQQSRSPPKQTL